MSSKCIPALAALVSALIALPAVADELGALLEQGGFESARLGDPIEAFDGLELLGQNPEAGTATYRRRGDELRIGGAAIDGVTYSFYDGRLYFISVQMTGEKNAAAIRRALEAAYGDGIATGAHPNEHIWPGSGVFVLYDLDAKTNRGMAAMTSSPIHARMRLDRTAPR
jgi:hypothetical protein